ncbi:centrosomal protein of 76 kDa-like isoform X2 [Liolophura sinensis]|uniref:centrosomal protein of 76 kDa-like isoform X2 n=1 Tax=Liolophura sinensis TaxID=3198878 RepID=UPI0031584E5F
MALAPEKLTELKQIIHNHLSQRDVQSRIRETVSEFVREEQPGRLGPVREDDFIQRLRQRGVIDDIMRQLQFDDGRGAPKAATHGLYADEKLTVPAVNKANVDPTRRYLYMQVLGGKAFLDHLQEPEPLPGQSPTTFTLHIHFRGQRLRSRPVPVACEPAINEGFLLELHKEAAGEAARMADTTTMLSISDPIHLVLVRTNGSGETTLVSSHFYEWRPVLASNNVRATTTVELLGTCSENKVPVGILEIQVELFPKTQQVLGEDVVRTQVNLEKGRQAEKERLFLVYAKQWWKEYLQIRPSHQDRLVKIFAQDENATNRPVCSFVKPLRAGRLLDTPRQAARFVNLIEHERVQAVGGGETREQWTTMHAFLCRSKGGCEDHALLLCSLLLGFGLEAYVCVGTKSKSSVHTWVMTISSDGLVTFWESLTGHRYIHNPIDPDEAPMGKQHQPKHPYRTIGCVFNHQNFYANCQPSNAVEVCEFELEDQARWKAMSQDAVLSVCGPGAVPHWPAFPSLCVSRLDAALVSNDLEQQLRVLVTSHRQVWLQVMRSSRIPSDEPYLMVTPLRAILYSSATGMPGEPLLRVSGHLCVKKS